MRSIDEKRAQEKAPIKWLRILFGTIFLVWLFYMVYDDEKIVESDLVTLNLTISKELEKGSKRNPFRIKIQSSEYKCKFGIYREGIFGIISEIKEDLKTGENITVKINNLYISELDSSNETIPVYYLQSERRVLFDVPKFNAARDKINFRWSCFIGVICVVFLVREIFFHRKDS